MNLKYFLNLILLLVVMLPTGLQGAERPQLAPLDHFRGTRLDGLREQIYQGAVAAANAGAGFEAVRLLQGLAKAEADDRIAKQAREQLKNWGMAEVKLDESRALEIDQQVRHQLEQEFQAQVDLGHVEVLIGFEEYDKAGQLLSRVLSRPLAGEAQKALDRFSRRFGLLRGNDSSSGETSTVKEWSGKLRAASDLIRRIDAAEFLLVADPIAGQMYWALLQRLDSGASAIRTARQQREEDPRSRFGFGRRTMPPGLMERFRGRFGGGRGEENQESREEAQKPTVISVDGVVASLDYLAKDDTALAIELLEMALKVLKDDPELPRLKAMLEQANMFALANLASDSRGNQAAVARFDQKRKGGKAEEIFSGEWVPTYELTIEPDQWQKLKASSKEYVQATFKCGKTELPNVGVRLKGGIGSYRPLEGGNKVALTLKLNQFEKGQRFLGLRKIVLNNSVQDDSYLREGLGYSRYRAAGLPASRVGHANVVINGESYGVYVQVEAVTSDFLKRWFQDGKGDLYEGSYGSDVTDWANLEADSDPEVADREAVRLLSEAAERSVDEGTLAPLKEHLDVVAFARYIALEILMDHWDGYISANNYRLYRDPKTKKFYFIPHGADQLFRNSGGELIRGSRGQVGQAIMETAEGRELYLAQVEDLMATVLHPEAAKEWIRDRYDNVRSLVLLDPKNSNNPMAFDAQMRTTLDFFGKKQRMVRWQMIALDDPQLSRRLESLNRGRRGFGGRVRGGFGR